MDEKPREQHSRRSSPTDSDSHAEQSRLDWEDNRSVALSGISQPSNEELSQEPGTDIDPLAERFRKLRAEGKIEQQGDSIMRPFDDLEGSSPNVKGVSKRLLTAGETNDERENKRQCIDPQVIVKQEPQDEENLLPNLLQATVDLKVSPSLPNGPTVSEAKDVKPANSLAPSSTGGLQGSTNLIQEHPPGISPETLDLYVPHVSELFSS